MNISRTLPTLVGAASLLALSLPGIASADLVPGYISISQEGEVLRQGSGACVRSGMWKRELATEACDPEIWAELHPPKVEVAAVEVRTVTVRKTLDAEALFGFDEANLTEEARGTLGGLANEIEETSVVGVRIVGHTDRIGPEEYNLKLSERRAEAVAAYLREETDTIPDTNIEMMGVGPAEPVVACEGLRGASLVECLKPNRRVVVEITTELEQETEVEETIKEKM